MRTASTSVPVEDEANGLPASFWIGGPGNAFCRREFVLKRRAVKGRLRILGDPHSYANHYWQMLPRTYPYDNWLVGGSFLKYRVFLNGKIVTAGPYRPLEDGVPVLHEMDVTNSLQHGANAIAVLSRGEARGFALELRILDEGGGMYVVNSGGDWKQLDANGVYRPICWEVPSIEQSAKGSASPGEYSEHLDGLVYPQGWREAGFDDSGWAPARDHGPARARCEATGEPGYALTRCVPVKVEQLGEGNYLVDFGRAVFGGIELAAPVGGGRVEVRLAEELQPNGHARYQLRTENCFQEMWQFAPDSEPLFHMGARMFRFAEVIGWRGVFDRDCLTATALGMPFDSGRTEFTCSDARLERLWQFCKNTVAHTTADVFTDCLTRERLAYEADTYVTMLTHLNVEGSLATPRRTLAYLVDHPTWPCEWRQFFVPLFHEYLLHSGDYDFVDRHYVFLRDETSYHGLIRDGVIREFPRECIVDWPEETRDDFVFGPGNAVANAFACWNLDLLAEMAGHLGRDGEVALFEEKAEELRAGFNRHLYDEASGLYVDSVGSRHSSLHANMYALRFGLVPESRVSRCVAYVKSRGMSCSVFTAQFLLETLFARGEEEAAIELMTSAGPRSWLEMIEHGAVATTESWLTGAKRNMSWAHPWGSSPANVIARHIFGLRPTKPGWSAYTFDPRPGGLQRGALRIVTPRGPITASFERENGAYRCEVAPEFDDEIGLAATAPDAALAEREPVLI